MKPPRMAFFAHRFVLSGLNLERFINLMQREEIPLLRVWRKGVRTLTCECYSADLPRIRTLVDEKGWRMDQESPVGFSGVLAWLGRRPGIPIGLVLTAAVMLTLMQFVWLVDVQGAGAYQAEIAAYLTESGYRPGLRRSAVDAQALEAALTYRYPQLAWFHVYARGMTLTVEVTPGVPMPAVDSGQPHDIVAARSGIVAAVRVHAGTAQVKAGDVVRKGQVLIRGEERGKDGSVAAVAAEGVVTARCWHSEQVALPLYDVTSSETGHESVQTCLRTPLGPLGAAPEEAPFLAYNTYIQETPVGGCFFPLVHQRITCREVAMEYTKRDINEVRQEAEHAAFRQLKTAFKSNEIIDKWVDYCMIEGDTLVLSASAEWLMDIGEAASP